MVEVICEHSLINIILLDIGEIWIWEVWGEIIGPCNNSGGTVTAGTQFILWLYQLCSCCYCFSFVPPFLWNCCMVPFFLLKPLKSNFLQFIEEAWTGQCVECKVPRELLLHTDQLLPPLEIRFERLEENIWILQQFRNGTGGWTTPEQYSVLDVGYYGVDIIKTLHVKRRILT